MKDLIGRVLLEWRIRTVLPHVRGNLLDIGCGTNELVKRYRGKGIGVDVFAWEGADLVVEDTARLPFPAEEFDTVTIIAALNHIPNRQEVLCEALRVLKPAGSIVLTMIPPFISTLWHKLRASSDVDQTERGMVEGEVYGLTRQEVRRLLNTAGFVDVRQRGFMLGINTLTRALKPGSG